MAAVCITGFQLDIASAVAIARHNETVVIDASALDRIRRARETVDRAIAENRPVYGLTTGLGSRVGERLDTSMLKSFSRQTIRGRAQSLGTPLPRATARAVMLTRLNSLCLGHAGAGTDVALILRDWLNAGLCPYIGSIGSVGASDLCQTADMALAMLGEGFVIADDGSRVPSSDALSRAGISPLNPGPKDGIALISHSGVTLARLVLAAYDAKRLEGAMLDAAALSLEAFGANLNPFDPRTVAASGLSADRKVASDVLERLRGSALLEPGAARRLQDPLSLRHIPQIHGAARAALEFAAAAVESALNGSPDSPCILSEDDALLSCGNYHSSTLALAAETLARGLAPAATAMMARITKLLTERFSGLPQYLALDSPDSNGLAPAVKIAEALNAEIQTLAIPPAVPPSLCADGVEDVGTTAPTSSANLEVLIGHLFTLTALEQAVAARALDLRGMRPCPGIEAIRRTVRQYVRPAPEDRPMAAEIESLADCLQFSPTVE